MPYTFIGWFHTLAAVIAVITGSIILYKTKGTFIHKLIGRIYAASMLVVCVTSFMIYRVHGSFGVLHFFAIISTLTLFAGMIPIYRRKPKNYRVQHLVWMYWSVIGLYCALCAEIFTRMPTLLGIREGYGLFYMLVGVASGLVGWIGAKYFKKKKEVWIAHFGTTS